MAAEVEVKKGQDDPTKGEVIAVVGVLAGIAALFSAVVWSDLKQQKQREEEAKLREEERKKAKLAKLEWFNNENASGNIVYELRDGRFLVVPRVGEQRIVIK
jgi:hypothetical protein